METYADFFDKDGFTNMWGRSNIYRNASTSAFDGNFFLKNPTMNPGLARRICSGSLLQFFGRDDVVENGVPTLGFYGQFDPLVQGYSCAESPFWLGKAFLCLHLPKDHPFWYGERDGVLYRRQFFDYNLQAECHWIQAVNLADFTVPYGIIRVDKHRLFKRPVCFTLGAYGFPDNGTEILRRECGKAKAIILKGRDFCGNEKQLAMTIYDGWDTLELVHSTGTNPDSEKSIVVYAAGDRKKHYGAYEFYTLISQIITKESHEDFTEEELFPIADIQYEDSTKTGAYGTVTVTLKDDTVRCVNFEEIEAGLTL